MNTVQRCRRRVSSALDMALVLAEDEFPGRLHDDWRDRRDWRERVEAVAPADVRRVAERHLLPDNLAMLVVGDLEASEPGDSGGRASVADVVAKVGGGLTMLPVRDPLSLEVVEP